MLLTSLGRTYPLPPFLCPHMHCELSVMKGSCSRYISHETLSSVLILVHYRNRTNEVCVCVCVCVCECVREGEGEREK